MKAFYYIYYKYKFHKKVNYWIIKEIQKQGDGKPYIASWSDKDALINDATLSKYFWNLKWADWRVASNYL